MKTRVTLSMIVLCLVAYSCGTAKNATKETKKDPVEAFIGDWDVVTSTPEGDLKSTMQITKNEDATFSGMILSDQGNIPMENLNIEGSIITSTVNVQGMEFNLKGTFTDNAFKGDFAGMGQSFPVAGTKKME